MVASSSGQTNTKVQQPQGGDAIVIASGGSLVLEPGATLYVNGSDVTTAVATGGIAGVATGYKLARGETSVTGSTGGDVTTGLATVVAVVASLGEDAAIGGTIVTAALGGTAGHITLKVWKPTATGDATPTLATAAKKVDWIAIGT
jgi:hypothetical protein